VSTDWRKVKCWTESSLILIGTEVHKRSGAPVALLARQSAEGLSYAGAGGAFFALKDAQRGALRDRMACLTADRSPIPALRKRDARWLKPELVVGVRHLPWRRRIAGTPLFIPFKARGGPCAAWSVTSVCRSGGRLV
jgi:ATP-dependent DNA ligase